MWCELAFSWKSCDGGGGYESSRLIPKGSNEYYRSKEEKMANSKGLCGYLHETWVIKKKDKMRLWIFQWIHERQRLPRNKWAPSLSVNVLAPERCQSLSEVKLGEIPDNRVLASTTVVKYDLHTHQRVAKLFNMYHTKIFIFISFIQKAPISLVCFIAKASLPSLCGYTLLCISLILLKLNPVHAT